MDIFIVRYITKDGFLIMNWVVSRHFYVIQFGEGDIDLASVCGLRRCVREEFAQNEFDTIVDYLYMRIRRGWCWKHMMTNGYRLLCLSLSNITKCKITALCRKNKIIHHIYH
jgi:hypothetical protein